MLVGPTTYSTFSVSLGFITVGREYVRKRRTREMWFCCGKETDEEGKKKTMEGKMLDSSYLRK